jgi:hypothetical protein
MIERVHEKESNEATKRRGILECTLNNWLELLLSRIQDVDFVSKTNSKLAISFTVNKISVEWVLPLVVAQ